MLSKQQRPRFSRGFSLLELMIVLALMVGLLAIAWPNMQRPLSRTTLNEAAQVLREAIDDGRHEAITTGKPIFIQMQNDHHEVRSGAYESFANEESDSRNNDGSMEVPVLEAANALPTDEKPTRMCRRWRLPETVVITEVNWTTNASSAGSEEDAMVSESSSSVSSSASSTGSLAQQGTAPEDSRSESHELELTHSDWWLPISATGQSRSASIVLYDTSIHETLTVTYASETGALEIVR